MNRKVRLIDRGLAEGLHVHPLTGTVVKARSEMACEGHRASNRNAVSIGNEDASPSCFEYRIRSSESKAAQSPHGD